MKLVVLMEAKENMTEMQSKTATILAISSIMEFEVAEFKCKEVMTIKQKPSKLAAVGRMCWEVLLDMNLFLKIFLNRICEHFCISTEMMITFQV